MNPQHQQPTTMEQDPPKSPKLHLNVTLQEPPDELPPWATTQIEADKAMQARLDKIEDDRLKGTFMEKLARSAHRFWVQSVTLSKKNIKLQTRNLTSTATQFLVGGMFLILLLILQAAVQANQTDDSTFVDTKVRNIETIYTTLDPCRVGPGLDTCYLFAVSSTRGPAYMNQTAITALVNYTLDLLGHSNAPVNASGGVFYFNATDTTKEVDAWLLANPNVTKAVLLLENSHQWSISSKPLRYMLQTNSTPDCGALGVLACNRPWFEYHLPIMTAVDSAFIALYGGPAESRIMANVSNFPHPTTSSTFDAMREYGSLFIYIALTFGWVIQLTLMVQEKEDHLVESMRQMGMTRSAYWTSWIIYSIISQTLTVFFLLFFGWIMDFDLFRKTDGQLLLTTLWLTAMAFSSWAMFMSTFMGSTDTARLCGVVVFLITFIAAPIVDPLIFGDPDQMYDPTRVIFGLFPFFPFYNSINQLIQDSSGTDALGLKWTNIFDNLLPTSLTNTHQTYWSVGLDLEYLVIDFFLYFGIAIYLDNVVPNEYGRAKAPWFFLMPSYWTSTASSRSARNKAAAAAPTASYKSKPNVDMDVESEARAVLAGNFDLPPAVVVRGLSKTFYGVNPVIRALRKLCGAPVPGFKAVDEVVYYMPQNQLFALLGHNGSGKSTTFNMIGGLSSASGGEVEIFGRSIHNDMSVIHSIMGVCPQHDILFGQLTAREHLEMYARIKGFQGDIEAEAQKRLDQTKLQYAANSYVQGFSGGMKRRLSIAIALLGDPAIVLLDEPTTGMDPVTRSEVLQMISDAKAGRVIVLTSHAMEEVDMLADKVAVMSHGIIQAVGTTLRLKKRFGTGYKMTMFTGNSDAVKEFMASNAPSGTNQIVNAASNSANSQGLMALQFQLARQDDPMALVSFFSQFEAQQQKLGVKEYSIGMSTLEEVFLNLSASGDKEHGRGWRGPKREIERIKAYKPVRAKETTSVVSQINALFLKSWAYQLKNLASCWSVVLFPVFIMVVMLLLDRFLLVRFRLDIVCGKGMAASDCKQLGYDLECVANLFEARFPSVPNNIEVGRIQRRRAGGAGANPNCDATGCFVGLETPSFQGAFLGHSDIAGLGDVSYDTSTTVFDWQADLHFLLNDQSCENAYGAQFDTSGCTEGQWCMIRNTFITVGNYTDTELLNYFANTDFDSFGTESKSCDVILSEPCQSGCFRQQESARCDAFQKDLGMTRDLVTNQQATGRGLAACQRTSTGFTFQANNASLWYLNYVKNNQSKCQNSRRINSTLPHFNAFDASLSGIINNITKSGSGLISNFSSNMFLEPVYVNLTLELWYATDLIAGSIPPFIMPNGSAVQGPTGYPAQRFTWFESRGLDSTDPFIIPSIADLCGYPFSGGLLAILEFNTTTKNNLCAAFGNLDKIRAMSMKVTDEVDLDVYHDWFGQQVSTYLMQTAPVSEAYQRRLYYSHAYAYDFSLVDTDNGQYRYLAYRNRTAVGLSTTANVKEVIYAMDSAIVYNQIQRQLAPRFKDMPVAFVCNRDDYLDGKTNKLTCDMLPEILNLSLIDFIATTLFPYIFLLHMFLVTNMIVYEKEQRLRVIMKMNGGLQNSVYWGVNFVYYVVQFYIMCAFMFFVGRGASLQSVSLHSPQVFWVFAISWGALLILFSFLLSIFFASTRTSTATVFLLILIFNLVGSQLIQVIINDPYSTEQSYSSLMWLPPFVMIRYVVWMSLAGAFNQKIEGGFHDIVGIQLGRCIGYMWAEIFALIFLIFYLDNTYVAGFGVRQKWNFFLDKDYWFSSKKGAAVELADIPIDPSVESLLTTSNNEDVKAEHERCVRGDDTNLLVRIVRLHKRYENGFVALKNLSLGINKNECFGLLGHNGAGKTTALNMLVGLFEPTGGDALIDGYSINTDMHIVQTRMGVCPQHDVVWGPLTCREHILFYARLKGVPTSELTVAVDKALIDVNLRQFHLRQAKSLSGGMKRRLSVAMSLIGSPSVVYLDEPSTGLDPASKRDLWNVVSNAKGNKSIVLTTHSMEEAEVLCDRIGIMALGEMQCLGTSTELKNRYGAGYSFMIVTKTRDLSNLAQVEAFVKRLFPKCSPLGKNFGGTFRYEVSRNEVALSTVFKLMETDTTKKELGLLDWSLTETTLEEVFLKLAELSHVAEAISAAPREEPGLKEWFQSWGKMCGLGGGGR